MLQQLSFAWPMWKAKNCYAETKAREDGRRECTESKTKTSEIKREGVVVKVCEASWPESGRRRVQLAVAFTMPTGATLVFSHGQSRENNSWTSDGAPAPNARATRGMRRGRQGGREIFRGKTVPATRYIGSIVINLCWKWKSPEGEAPRLVYEPASLNKWGGKEKDTQ